MSEIRNVFPVWRSATDDPAKRVAAWYYGPTPTDDDPGKMWCYGCGGEVTFHDEAAICGQCGVIEDGS